MNNNLQEEKLLEAIEIETSAAVSFAVIWLHGLGADGNDFVNLVPQLKLPRDIGVRFIFPHAPQRSVTINRGMLMRAWYDITSLTALEDDLVGIRQSCQQVSLFIEKQLDVGIPASNIILAGFSQGGVIALQTALNFQHSLGGVLSLSSYLPPSIQLQPAENSSQQSLPIFMAHGDYDDLIPLQLAEHGRDLLKKLGYQVSWFNYPMGHQVCLPEINDIRQWFVKILQRNTSSQA